ncbi:hypothetical protein [Paenibacillus sp. P22]|uniref:family 4 glycosyl hydrolase n=1 Tax=Paenibacillus sp. P22 TaxID=483908 RepID=UPI000661344C
MKIVLIGGGSFVFAPTVLEDCIVKHRMEGELVLVDLNLEAAAAMAGAGRALARQHGVDLLVSETDNREEALPGADFVILSAAPQGALRWKMDFDILKQFGLDDQARECGGLGGMLGAFRSIAMAMELARDMERLCPAALLLDVTNPMPRVVTAVARFSSVGVAGFCNIAHRSGQGYGLLPGLIGRKPHEVDIVTGGLNHFAWVLSMKDKQSGADLLPELRSFVEHGDWSGLDEDLQRELDVMKRWLGQYGGGGGGGLSIIMPSICPYSRESGIPRSRLITARPLNAAFGSRSFGQSPQARSTPRTPASSDTAAGSIRLVSPCRSPREATGVWTF